MMMMSDVLWLVCACSARGRHDTVNIVHVEAEYTDEWMADKDERKVTELKEKDINHYRKFKAIWVAFEYPDDKQQERLNFHPAADEQEMLSWRILSAGPHAGLPFDSLVGGY